MHLHDQGLKRLSNPAILEKARHKDRILLTYDLNFGELVAVSGTGLPSVVIFRLSNMHPERVNWYLHSIITNHRHDIEKGVL